MIKYPQTFSQMQPANFSGIFDWDFLAGAFKNTNIKLTDIDAIVEKRDNFLIFETKNIGVPIPTGQKYLLERLIRLGKGKVTVFILYGKTPETIEGMERWYWNTFTKTIDKEGEECDSAHVLWMTASWFKIANGRG